MNLNDISTQLLYTTVQLHVTLKKGGQASGTGFIYQVPAGGDPNRSFPLLITNAHVLDGALSAVVELVESVDGAPVPSRRVRVELQPALWTKFTNAAEDIAAIPLGGALNQLQSAGKQAFFRSINPDLIPSQEVIDDLAAMEEITFIGYPSGLADQANATPLIRRGITSTPVWNKFEGERRFIIDAGVFEGSSGSPVFLFNQGAYATKEGLTVGNRLLLLGIISQTLKRPAKQGEGVYLGLGVVVRADAIKEFANRVVTQLK